MSRQILVVDSLCTNRILTAGDLLAARFRVKRAEGLSAALKSIREGSPDLVIAGLGPRESTTQLLDAIRKDSRTASLPVIAVGADGSEAARLAALRAGADEVFSRPVDAKLLLARIRSLLRRQDDLVELRAS